MTEVWGELAKSQSDSEKIEEAVTRLISAHESDPEAHLGEGDSLQSHKASDIIDHLARSIYTDKFAYDRFKFETNFETVDIWHKSSGAELFNLSDFTIYSNSTKGYTNYAYLYPGAYFEDYGFCQASGYFNVVLRFFHNANVSAYFGPIGYDDIEFGMTSGVGFKCVNGSLYVAYCASGGSETLIDLDYILDDNYHKFVIQVIDDFCYFLIDDVQVYSISVSLIEPVRNIALFWITSSSGSSLFELVRFVYDQEVP